MGPMTPDERADVEARADRCLRRGELSEALAMYRSLAQAFPGDAAIERKIATVTESLQPAELHSAKAAAVRDPPRVGAAPLSPEQEGERLFALGDYVGATAAYRRALKDNPDNVLVLERLEELYRLARAAPRTTPTDTPLPQDPAALLQALLDRISSRRRV